MPVVDDERHLLGVVAVDDLVDVLEEEATEDIYRLAQMSEEAIVFSPIPRAIRTRLPWLAANPGTALISSTVVAQFAGTIAAVSILAVPMTLRRFGIDPALGSSMMVTASTDILGFALFLGLASCFIVGLI